MERTYQSLRQQSTAQTSATKSHAIVDDNVSAFPGRKGGCGGAAGSRGDGGGCAGGGGDRGTGGRGGGGKSGVGTILGVAGGGADMRRGNERAPNQNTSGDPELKSVKRPTVHVPDMVSYLKISTMVSYPDRREFDAGDADGHRTHHSDDWSARHGIDGNSVKLANSAVY